MRMFWLALLAFTVGLLVGVGVEAKIHTRWEILNYVKDEEWALAHLDSCRTELALCMDGGMCPR